jgi:hypothetical protein
MDFRGNSRKTQQGSAAIRGPRSSRSVIEGVP